MTLRFICPVVMTATAFFVGSCGNSSDVPILAGNTQAAAAEGESVYLKAKEADDAGKTAKAIKLYDETATRYPFAKSAPQARFRQAELLEQKGEVVKSFKAYQEFLTRYTGSSLYTTALNRQARMAQSAADGEVKSGFLGIKSKLSLEKTVEMLEQTRDNAPKTRTASKAQFTIGELNYAKKKAKESIAAYRKLVADQPDSPEAPEALFRVGEILTKEADSGNKNQATLDLAREAFNDYMIQYPGHSRNAEARRLVANLGSREIERTFEIAQFYEKTGKLDSAKVYYRDVVRRSASGKTHEAAKARLKALGE